MSSHVFSPAMSTGYAGARGGGSGGYFAPSNPSSVDPNPNLYVHNVPRDSSEEELREIFGKFGTIERVRLKVNQKIGPHAVYAFVTFSTTLEARQAMEQLQGADVRGRCLRIEFQRTPMGRSTLDDENRSPSHSRPADRAFSTERMSQTRSPAVAGSGAGRGSGQPQQQQWRSWETAGVAQMDDGYSQGPPSKRGRYETGGAQDIQFSDANLNIQNRETSSLANLAAMASDPRMQGANLHGILESLKTAVSQNPDAAAMVSSLGSMLLQQQASVPAQHVTSHEEKRSVAAPWGTPSALSATMPATATALAEKQITPVPVTLTLDSMRAQGHIVALPDGRHLIKLNTLAPVLRPSVFAKKSAHAAVSPQQKIAPIPQPVPRPGPLSSSGWGSQPGPSSAAPPVSPFGGDVQQWNQMKFRGSTGGPGMETMGMMGMQSSLGMSGRPEVESSVFGGPQDILQSQICQPLSAVKPMDSTPTALKGSNPFASLAVTRSSDVVWAGSMARSEKKKVNVKLTRLCGDIEKIIGSDIQLLNVCHRSGFEEMLRKSLVAVGLLHPSGPDQSKMFSDYIQYFKSKDRAGVARLGANDSRFVYIVPPEIAPFRNLLPYVPEQELLESLYIAVSGKHPTPAAASALTGAPTGSPAQYDVSQTVNAEKSGTPLISDSNAFKDSRGPNGNINDHAPSSDREVIEEDISLTLGEDLEAGEVRGDENSSPEDNQSGLLVGE